MLVIPDNTVGLQGSRVHLFHILIGYPDAASSKAVCKQITFTDSNLIPDAK